MVACAKNRRQGQGVAFSTVRVVIKDDDALVVEEDGRMEVEMLPEVTDKIWP
jgi:hypothetical protein